MKISCKLSYSIKDLKVLKDRKALEIQLQVPVTPLLCKDQEDQVVLQREHLEVLLKIDYLNKDSLQEISLTIQWLIIHHQHQPLMQSKSLKLKFRAIKRILSPIKMSLNHNNKWSWKDPLHLYLLPSSSRIITRIMRNKRFKCNNSCSSHKRIFLRISLQIPVLLMFHQ